jgi:hypothetical protein
VHVQAAAHQQILDAIEGFFDLARLEGVQRGGLLRLRLLDRRRPARRRRGGLLRARLGGAAADRDQRGDGARLLRT